MWEMAEAARPRSKGINRRRRQLNMYVAREKFQSWSHWKWVERTVMRRTSSTIEVSLSLFVLPERRRWFQSGIYESTIKFDAITRNGDRSIVPEGFGKEPRLHHFQVPTMTFGLDHKNDLSPDPQLNWSNWLARLLSSHPNSPLSTHEMHQNQHQSRAQ